jgi:hypothetical protein
MHILRRSEQPRMRLELAVVREGHPEIGFVVQHRAHGNLVRVWVRPAISAHPAAIRNL